MKTSMWLESRGTHSDTLGLNDDRELRGESLSRNTNPFESVKFSGRRCLPTRTMGSGQDNPALTPSADLTSGTLRDRKDAGSYGPRDAGVPGARSTPAGRAPESGAPRRGCPGCRMPDAAALRTRSLGRERHTRRAVTRRPEAAR